MLFWYNFIVICMDELKVIGKILIKESEINILNKYNIIVDNCTSIDEVLLLIDMYLNDVYDITDEEYEELDILANNLMERKYYMETHK